MPPNINDWLPIGHLARFVDEFVQSLDLSDWYDSYENENSSGRPPYDPAMMLSVLLYAQLIGTTSSRTIERALADDIAFRFLSGNLKPDHDTIAAFRFTHRERLRKVFVSAVQLGMSGGMISLNHAAMDGTKIRANASKGARKTKDQLERDLDRIKDWVGSYLDECDEVDKQEDEQFGKGNNPYFLPPELADPDALRKFIKESLKEQAEQDTAEAAPETEAKPTAENSATKKLEKRVKKLESAIQALDEQVKEEQKNDPTGRKRRDREKKRGGAQTPKVNVTDSDARTMKFRDGSYNEGYNCQIAVDDYYGLIVAAGVTQDATDRRQLLPTLIQVKENTGWLPDNVSADNGYLNFEHIQDPCVKSVEFFVTPSAPMPKESNESNSEKMRQKMQTRLGQHFYQRRSTLVEPVFGMIKHARKFRQFLMRSLASVEAEWMLWCTAHNLLKIYRAGATI